jgi:hypothetical protein
MTREQSQAYSGAMRTAILDGSVAAAVIIPILVGDEDE